jgi:hypothetical protein
MQITLSDTALGLFSKKKNVLLRKVKHLYRLVEGCGRDASLCAARRFLYLASRLGLVVRHGYAGLARARFFGHTGILELAFAAGNEGDGGRQAGSGH